MRNATVRPGFRGLAALILLLSCPATARASDAGDASPEAAGEDAGEDGATAASRPSGFLECPVANVGMLCDDGLTCIPATCGTIGTAFMRPCAACSFDSQPLCQIGSPCGDGGLCHAMGGGGGSGITLDGGMEDIFYDQPVCAPPPQPVYYYGGGNSSAGGYESTNYPAGCCEVAPLGTSPAGPLTSLSVLGIAIAGWRRRGFRRRRDG